MLRTALIAASTHPQLRRLVTEQRLFRELALRFVAGESSDDGLGVARGLVARGRTITFDYLGESVHAPEEARAASKVYLELLGRIGTESLPAGISVKPTQMGLAVDAGLCRELLEEICTAADAIGAHVTLDMEASDVTEATVRLTEQLRDDGHDVGCAVQTYLHRTRADVERLSAVGASLRLCKGAYLEPADRAFQARAEVDTNYAECAVALLHHGTYPRIATHDNRLIDGVKRTAERFGLGPDDFEFQMLYGVREPLQAALVEQGYRVRVYLPFGDQWYPYYMRRLAERPANVVFFLRALVSRT